ncbi:deaminase domain-containing protein, partial [Pseudomonas syringae]|uniref:deaminase domain-containing protein n=1 Tax=Pseudomonas syringae TaxID=317 RepID=UPI00051615E1
ISTAINGGSLKDNLGSALVSQGFDLAAAAGNKNLGDFADFMELDPGSAEKVFLHAMLGGALSAARGGDFKTGAIAAGAAEGLTAVAADGMGKYLNARFVTDEQFRVATAQIVGIAAGSLVNGDPNDAAWVAGNVERYNEQLHPRAAQLIEREAPQLAADKNISQEEAARRMAVALAYYTDEGWSKSIPENDAKNIDTDTLTHLGVALAPIADQYARPDASVDGSPRSYSGNETAAMIVDFQASRPAAYKDSNRNIDYLGDPQGNKTQRLVDFYETNLDFSDKPTDVLGSVAGGLAGIGRSAWGMVRATAKVGGELLGGDPLGGVNSLLGPVADSSLDPVGQMTTRQSGRAFVSNLQGNSYESAAQITEIGTDVASMLVPVASAGKFGQLAKAGEASSLARADSVLIAKSEVSVDLASTSRSEALGGSGASGLADDAADFYGLNVSNVDYTSQLERTGTVRADDAFAATSDDVVLTKYSEPCCFADGAKATATVIDTAPMAQRVMDVRAGLPSGLRRSGNVAVAEIDIPGIPKQMAAHSQVSDAGKGLVGSGNGNFVAQSVPNKAGDLVYRGIDTEYKILDNIADQLGRNTSARGTVNILTEKAACASCLNVAEQFKAKYPNITVNILDNQGVMLRPPRKTP